MVYHYIVLFTLLTTIHAIDEPEKGCVNFPPSACPVVDKETSFCLCQRIESDTTVVCCNIHTEFELKESLSCAFQKKETQLVSQQALTKLPPVTALHILNSTLERLDVSLPYFQGLIGLSVTQSHIPRIMGRFPPSITCLNLSSNYLLEIDPNAFKNVPQLGYLDLSKNNLTSPPILEFRNNKAYFFLDLSVNPLISCKQLQHLRALKNNSIQINFVNEINTYCTKNSDFHWFNSVNVIAFHQLDFIDEIDKDCPKGEGWACHCGLMREVEIATTQRHFVYVNCSHRGLVELPSILPAYTQLLNVSNNNITRLDFLATKDRYHSISQMTADNNRIESITVLEGSAFIERFTVLSLKNNNIKSIPKYLLSNVFDRNNFRKIVQLGKNRLPCDCSTAQVLKVWLLANKEHITDYDELLCENLDGIKVVDLDQSKVCIVPRDWTDYIYYIIALEILLFVLLVSKVSYDYWVFKTTGYLPWPASKMPRLPCDWVFEL